MSDHIPMSDSDTPLAQAMMELLADERSDTRSKTLELIQELGPEEEWNRVIHGVAQDDELDIPRAITRGIIIALRAADVARRRQEPLHIPD